MDNKRGQGLSTNAIILIILGIFILVILIIGFTMGWDVIAPWLSKENVDDVSKSCALACNLGEDYGFCGQKRILIDEDKNEYKDITCYALSEISVLDKYAIEGCPGIDCAQTIGIVSDVAFVKDADPCVGKNPGDSIFVVDKKVKTFVTC